MFYKEITKKEELQDKKLILDFVNVLRTNSQYLGNLAISLPPMAEIRSIMDGQQETIRHLNEKIQFTYRKHVGFIMKKEMEFNLNKFKKEDYNRINLISGQNTNIDKEEDEKNTNENPTPDWNSKLTKEFIEECIEPEISDDKDNNNSNADAIKLSKDIREELKKHKEVYERVKEARRQAVFEDLS